MTPFVPSWPGACPPLDLAPGEIHVWCAILDRPPDEVARFAAILSEEERARAGRFVADSVRQQFQVARGLLRTLLGRYLDLNPRQVQFRLGSQGKPALANEPSLQFNLSHSYGVALLAVSRHGEIGVDVERLRPFENDLELADRFFTPPEAIALRSLGAGQRQQAFFQVWTQKEAFLKAKGTGLSGGLERVQVSVTLEEPARVVAIDGDEEAAQWSLEVLTPFAGYIGAFAMPRREYQLRCWHWQEE
jgi:4'-phosphopantetheinyl transferase